MTAPAPDPLGTPWSSRSPSTWLPPVGGALTDLPCPAPGGRSPAGAPQVVLVTPWSSYWLPMPGRLPAVDRLPGLAATPPPLPVPRRPAGERAPA